jgi:uncharacterized protein (TIGR03067 family)
MRKLLTAVAALVAVGLLAAADAKDDNKKELDRFTGTWKAVSETRDGKEVPKDEVEKIKLVVKGESYTLTTGDETIEGTHKLDPSKSPRTIDAVRTKGPDKDKPLLGIYELTDDTYKACFAPPGKDRPTDFTSKAGSGNRLYTFKKEKP